MHLLAIKKLKHKLVEKLNEETADSLGISRAILIHGTWVIALVCVYLC